MPRVAGSFETKQPSSLRRESIARKNNYRARVAITIANSRRKIRRGVIPCATGGATHPSTGETGSGTVVGDGVLLPRPQLSNPLATLVMYLLHRAFFTM